MCKEVGQSTSVFCGLLEEIREGTERSGDKMQEKKQSWRRYIQGSDRGGRSDSPVLVSAILVSESTLVLHIKFIPDTDRTRVND